AIRSARRFIYFSWWGVDITTIMPETQLPFHELVRESILVKNQSLRIYILWNQRTTAKLFDFYEIFNLYMQLAGPDNTDRVQFVGAVRDDLLWEPDDKVLPKFESPALEKAMRDLTGYLIKGAHHVKTIVVDGEIAFCNSSEISPAVAGGKNHEVGVRISGPCARCIEEEFVARWNRERSRHLSFSLSVPCCFPRPPDKLSAGIRGTGDSDSCGMAIATVTTDPSGKSWQKRTGILHAYADMITGAAEYIYIENQYFRDIRIAELLGTWLRESASHRLVLVLPGTAEEWEDFDTIHWDNLSIIDRLSLWGTMSSLLKIARPDGNNGLVPFENARIVSPVKNPYIHSKLMITDPGSRRPRMITGSANINPRGLNGRSDNELDVLIEDPRVVNDAYRKCMELFFKGGSAFEDDSDILSDNNFAVLCRLYWEASANILRNNDPIVWQYKRFGFLT
ncbi:MAG: hypothetical protein JW768_05790, partial [Chitinispirillaceae bacterium]|nr:hypothetical protein [Chitinispirillaceae bacterium]